MNLRLPSHMQLILTLLPHHPSCQHYTSLPKIVVSGELESREQQRGLTFLHRERGEQNRRDLVRLGIFLK